MIGALTDAAIKVEKLVVIQVVVQVKVMDISSQASAEGYGDFTLEEFDRCIRVRGEGFK